MKSPGRSRLKLNAEQMTFCRLYVRLGNQTEAYRSVWPQVKNPSSGASKLLKKESICCYLARIIEKAEEKSAERAAEEIVLSCEVADAKLTELIKSRRLTRGEILTRMTRGLELPGVEVSTTSDEQGNTFDVRLRTEEYTKTLGETAPIEDSDLLRAIDLTYKRFGVYHQKDSKQQPGPTVIVPLYTPQWMKGRYDEAPALEASLPEKV